MKLQLALDTLTLEECLNLLEKVAPYVDIIEVGTPFLLEEGVKPIKAIKAKYPDKMIFADAKIIDGAKIETQSMIDAGADIVSVVAVSHDQTIIDAVSTAKKHGKQILADFIAVGDIEERAKRLVELGIDILCVHTAYDIQKTTDSPLAELIRVQKHCQGRQVGIAGGVNLRNIEEIAKASPDIVVVGGAICNQADPLEAAQTMKELMSHGR